MKKFFIICTIALCANAAFAQTLFTFGKNETSKAAFLRAYNKNKPSTTDKEKSMREYLDLYINFKLKVKAAFDIKLDSLPQIKYDVQNFRDQVVDNYMNDDKGLQLIMDEASKRASKDIRVLYFYVPVAADAKPVDTLKAFSAINELYKTLQTGSTNYKEIVADYGTKFTSIKFADAGFITVFTLPYELENIVYNTKTNAISLPLRSNKGWFIFKPIEERVAIGKWKVAQLLFAFPLNADEATKLALKSKADSVYKLLKNGMSFADAASKFSDDRMSNLSGGVLQEFGASTYSTAFETNVIKLQNDNDLSLPFETSFGCHIVKKISNKKIPLDKTDATFLYEIKQSVTQDARVNSVKEKFISSIAQKTGLKRLPNIKDDMFFSVYDSTLNIEDAEKKKINVAFAQKQIMRFEDGTIIKGLDWIKYIKTSIQNGDLAPLSNKKMLDNFTKQLVSEYYKKNLEKFNDDFKYQMLEFKEGNMLFEIMERNVWSKAGADSISLRKYFNIYSQNYKWAASADVIIFNCTDEASAKKARKEIGEGIAWNSIIDKSENKVQADSGRYEIVQIPNINENSILKNNMITELKVNNTDDTWTFVKVIKIYKAGLQRSFNEARGLVINDYQSVLEQQWIETLKKKYPVKVSTAVFSEMLK